MKKPGLMHLLVTGLLAFSVSTSYAGPRTDEEAINARLGSVVSNGSLINLRQTLVEMGRGDFLVRLVVFAKSSAANTTVQILIDGRPTSTVLIGESMFPAVLEVGLNNGVDYNNLQLSVNGSAYISQITAVISKSSIAPARPVTPGTRVFTPNVVAPEGSPYKVPRDPKNPKNRNSIEPTYPAPIHRYYPTPVDTNEYREAYDYANSGSGLNMNASDAEIWARRVANLPDSRSFIENFKAAYTFAYSSAGINLSAEAAREFADTTASRWDADIFLVRYIHAFKFAFDGSGLNLGNTDTQLAQSFAERMASHPNFDEAFACYKDQYRHAYEGGGLNKSSKDARKFASEMCRVPGIDR